MKSRDRLALLRLAAPSASPSPASIVPITEPELERLLAFGEFNNKVAEQLQLWTTLQAETEGSEEEMIDRIDQEASAAIRQVRDQADGYKQQVKKSVADIISLCQQNIEKLKQVARSSNGSDERCQQACRNATTFSAVPQRKAEIMSATEELFANTKIPFLEKPSELRITTLRFPDSEFSLSVTPPGVRDQPFDLKLCKPKWTLDFSMNTSHLTFNKELCTVTKSGATGHASSTVLGTQPLEDAVVHSWKVKILTAPVSGTSWYGLGVTQLREPLCSYSDAAALSSAEQVFNKNGTSSAPPLL